jgi:thiosulfate/3-mercaptopyruvate sulfurtransferase
MRVLRLLIVAAVAPAVVSSPGSTQAASRAGDTVLVSTSWVAERLGSPELVVLYVGPRSEYDAGHIPGARFMASQSFVTQTHENGHEPTLMTQVPTLAALDSVLEMVGVSDRSRIVIHGGSLTGVARLYVTLDHVGLGARTSILDGGLALWRDEGKALTTEAPMIERGSLTLAARGNVIADLALVKAAARIDAAGPAAVTARLIDARDPQFYTGASAGNMPRAGHIPTAMNIPYSTFVQRGSLFKSAADIQSMFTAAGVAPGGSVITYCHIGMQASVAYVAAKVAGFDPQMYDGSFDEWSRRSELPVGKK